jgi:low affinity Fe/Cu permease
MSEIPSIPDDDDDPVVSRLRQIFDTLAKRGSALSGRPVAFVLAVLVIVTWLVTGPVFGFNNTWQLVINTGTTIVTFLMVFLIQNSQNRDTVALHLKIDELIMATAGADDRLLDLEELDDRVLERKQAVFERRAEAARAEAARRRTEIR